MDFNTGLTVLGLGIAIVGLVYGVKKVTNKGNENQGQSQNLSGDSTGYQAGGDITIGDKDAAAGGDESEKK